jgi:(2Fe-2S) ferredoxin
MIAVNEMFYEQVTSTEAGAIIEEIKTSGRLPEPNFTMQMPELSEPTNRS